MEDLALIYNMKKLLKRKVKNQKRKRKKQKKMIT